MDFSLGFIFLTYSPTVFVAKIRPLMRPSSSVVEVAVAAGE
jgi:hypothetical protein